MSDDVGTAESFLAGMSREDNPERWRQMGEGVDPAHTDLLAQIEADKDEHAVKALGQQLRFFLARWRFVHPQQFDTEAGEELAREVLARFSHEAAGGSDG